MIDRSFALRKGDRFESGSASALVLKPFQMGTPRVEGKLYVGLTGGIGSGKTSVCLVLARLGATVFSADDLAREVVEPGSEGLRQIVDVFGSHILNNDGSLDRAGLGKLVFADPSARKTLEAITHPLIGKRAMELASGADTKVVVYDVPLLVETHMNRQFDLVAVVDAPLSVRLDRLEGRGLNRDAALSRISAQATSEQRMEVADIWFDNSGSKADIESVVEDTFNAWLLPLTT